jgi:glutamate dehydrogenase
MFMVRPANEGAGCVHRIGAAEVVSGLAVLNDDAEGANGSPLLERVGAILADDAATLPLLPAFAAAYLRRIPEEELVGVPDAQIAAQVRSVYCMLDGRGTETVILDVRDPTVERDGYETAGTVIEFVTDDIPFLVDSVIAALSSHDLHPTLLLHPVIGTIRDDAGRLIAIVPAREAARRESVQHYELDRRLDPGEASAIAEELYRALQDVRNAVRDFAPMKDAVRKMIAIAVAARGKVGAGEVEEAVGFLEWLLDLNFVFLGYREYRIEDSPQGKVVQITPGSGLGILRMEDESRYATPTRLADLPPALAARFEGSNLLTVTKTNRHATVHRHARMDYVSIRTFDDQGRTNGEARLVGLLTSKAYMAEAARVPVLREKLARIIAAEDLIEGSHDYKAVIQLFESFPKDDLFSASDDELRASIIGLIEHEEHEKVKLFLRRDQLHRNVSVLVVVPRDRFNATLRHQLQELLVERLDGNAVDYRLSIDETGDARLHFTVWTGTALDPAFDFKGLEQEVLALTRTWADRIRDELRGPLGEAEAARVVERWAGRFPEYYKGSTELSVAVADMRALDALAAADRRLMVGVHNEKTSDERLTRVAVYNKGSKLDLSQMMPLLEDAGLRVVEEVPTRISGDENILIHDFGVLTDAGTAVDVEACGERLCAAIADGLRGDAESDALNRLIVKTALDHHQIAILRAYRTYRQLVLRSFSLRYIDETLAGNAAIAENLVRLFEARFSPEADTAAEAAIRAAIRHDLEGVVSLDEDSILRGFQGLIDATVRTSVYVPGRSVMAFKLRSARVPDMPAPKPVYEIFVYGREMEGVHLRGGAVSRGGIRWSVRREDYRTEVLGLMKAQMTKNAVIVPDGAKGGFIVRGTNDPSYEEVTAAYEAFVRGLLDLTDNLVNGRPVHPDHVRIHDGPDPYLVVAADRGTARFSDNANAISAEYGFWLDDAFASGGSRGYDHKALGITARGAWESVNRHFSDLGIHPANDPVTVVGIGDMSGDVFGNGMLLSDKLRLVAAFDHRDIFLDPDPDPAVSFAERKRLAEAARSSWQDYDHAAISDGGGVFSRAAKRIQLSPQAMRVLGIDQSDLAPNQLISAILRAPVDLLWNGGIGTYVKGSSESHDAVQDRVNDAVRVNGADLRAKVVGEGGNLGFTQEGRIEFDRVGGRIFTDFIDNSGGVHCSDREVNLKILLGMAIERGALDPSQRDGIVTGVAPNVVAAVVYDNFLQAQILAQEAARSANRIDAYEDLMQALEEDNLLDRSIEWLPSSDEMAERSRAGGGMARPELAVLLAYAKRSLSAALLASDLPDWDHFDEDVAAYFPGPVIDRFGSMVADHPLRRELVATIVANQVINSLGITFVSRLEAETGATAADVVRAYRVARAVTGASDRWATIESLEGKVAADVQRELLEGVDALVELVARWYLGRPKGETVTKDIDAFATAFAELADELHSIGPQTWREVREEECGTLIARGVPEELARRHAYQMELVHGPDIIDVAGRADRPVLDVARVFFRVGQAFRIDWLESQVESLPARTRWERWSVQTLNDELLTLRRVLVERVLAEGEGRTADEAVDLFLLAHANEEGRLIRFMRLLARDGVTDAASVVVASRQIRSLIG